MNHWITESLKWLALVSLLTNIGEKTYKNIFSTATSRAEHFLTAKWSLREGDEEVNKRRIKQQIIIFGLNDNLSSGAIFKFLFVKNF